MLTRLAPARDERGFSLAEMLITMVVFAILASIAVPVFINQRNKSQIQALKTDLINASLVMEEKRTANNGRYPDKLPREVSYKKDATVAYTFPPGRASYCLQMTLNGRKMQVSSASDTPVNVASGTDCSFGVSLSAPRLTGQLTNDNIPQLFWDKVNGAVKYNVYANDVLKTTVTGTQATYSLNLARQDGGTSVRYRIAAVSSVGIEGERSRAVQLNAPMMPPVVSSSLSILSSTEGADGNVAAVLKWTPVPSASKYELYDAVSNELITVVTGTTYNVTVPMGQNRTYYVIAANDAGTGPESNEVTVQGPVLPAPILNGEINASLVTTLTWDVIPGAASYRVFRDGAPFGNVAFDGAGKAVIASGYSTSGSVYKYEVLAVDNRAQEGKKSNPVNIGVQISTPVLTASDAAISSATGQKGVKFTWQNIPGATEYLIYDGTNSTLLKSVPTGSITTTIDALVDPNKTRTFYLVARGASGESPRSNTVTVKGILPTFSGLDYAQLSPGAAGVNLSWTLQPYATSYEITITGGATPLTYTVAKGVTSWSTSPTFLGSGTTNVIRTFSVKALYHGAVASPEQSRQVFMPAKPTALASTKTSVKHTTSDWNWTWARPSGTTQTQVTYNGVVVFSSLGTQTYSEEIPYGSSGTLAIRAWSPDQKMISQPVSIASSSVHPALWSGNGGQQYNFLGTGPVIVGRNTFEQGINELYVYTHGANGGITARYPIAGKGWGAMKFIVPVYDWQGKGSSGLFVVERASGTAYYYSSLGSETLNNQRMERTVIGQGRNWAGYRQIVYYHEWGGPGVNALLAIDHSNNLWRFTTNSDGTINDTAKLVGTGWIDIAGSSDWDGDGKDEIMMSTPNNGGDAWMYQRSGDAMTSAGVLNVGTGGWGDFAFQPFESWGGLRGVQAHSKPDGIHYWYGYQPGTNSLLGSTRVQNGTGWASYWETSAARNNNCNTIGFGTVCN